MEQNTDITPATTEQMDELSLRLAAEGEQKVEEINARHAKEYQTRQASLMGQWKERQPEPLEQAILDLTIAVNRLTDTLIANQGETK